MRQQYHSVIADKTNYKPFSGLLGDGAVVVMVVLVYGGSGHGPGVANHIMYTFWVGRNNGHVANYGEFTATAFDRVTPICDVPVFGNLRCRDGGSERCVSTTSSPHTIMPSTCRSRESKHEHVYGWDTHPVRVPNVLLCRRFTRAC